MGLLGVGCDLCVVLHGRIRCEGAGTRIGCAEHGLGETGLNCSYSFLVGTA